MITAIFKKLLAVLRVLKNAVIYLTFETVLLVILGILAGILIQLGFSTIIAISISIILFVVILLFTAIAYIKRRKTKTNSYLRVQGEVKLADNIAQIVARKSPKEWEEYQDWLHDILLHRSHLIARNYPMWKVSIITYWQLTVFSLTVSLIKLKKIARAVWKIR
ncbi:MAG: hypothetical protein QNJ60_21025 [Xenococcaceae cyanobacterium MO_188.B19]|nr:hypothetical protein [Xenococcaceae cyanobacterium MO_188.B19]